MGTGCQENQPTEGCKFQGRGEGLEVESITSCESSMPMEPTPVFLPGKSHGQSSLAGSSPWGCKELNMTEQLNLVFN